CSLEGLTRDEAAQQLGLPLGTLKNRLEKARKLLRARLDTRGLTPCVAFVASVLGEQMASAAIPAGLLTSTVQAPTSAAAGNALAEVISANVAALSEGVLKAMFIKKLKVATALMLAAVVLAVGSAVLTSGSLGAQLTERAKTNSQAIQIDPASQPKDA